MTKNLSGNGRFLYYRLHSGEGFSKCVDWSGRRREERRKGVNDMRKHGNGLEVGRAGTMEVKATKGAESTKAPKKQTGGDLRSGKR